MHKTVYIRVTLYTKNAYIYIYIYIYMYQFKHNKLHSYYKYIK